MKPVTVQVLNRIETPFVESASADATMGMDGGRFVVTVTGDDVFEWAGGKLDQ